jgi:hypothetical protein
MKTKRVLVTGVILLAFLVAGPMALAVEPPPTGTGTIMVHKFNDANLNGVQDAGEEDIEGWMIYILRWTDTGVIEVAQGFTGADGWVSFMGLEAPGTYKVWEEKRDCWEPTTPPGLTGLWWGGYPGYFTVVLLDPSQTITVHFGNAYTCPPPLEGCTPGYFRNERHLDEWFFDPSSDFDATFGVYLFDPDITLWDAIWMGGGGVKKLARHGTAALLSAAHPGVDYPLTVAQVIALVQAGDTDTLAMYNELGCPLN